MPVEFRAGGAATQAQARKIERRAETRDDAGRRLPTSYVVAKSTFGTSLTDGGTLKKSPSDLKPNRFATRLLGKVSHLLR